MNSWAILVGSFTIIGVMVTVALLLSSSINSRIEEKVNDPNFIRKIASEIRLPFLIFDEEKRYLYDDGALDIIENIEIVRDGRDIKQIVITPKRFLAVAPIMESLDPEVQFEDPERGKGLNWIYKTNLPEMAWGRTKPPKKRFKLQIIRAANFQS